MLGSYADRHGRKGHPDVSIRLMMLGTAIIVVLPGYATWRARAGPAGRAARPGFLRRRGVRQSHGVPRRAGQPAQGLPGQLAVREPGLATPFRGRPGTALTTLFTPEQLTGWAWRIPFAFGLAHRSGRVVRAGTSRATGSRRWRTGRPRRRRCGDRPRAEDTAPRRRGRASSCPRWSTT
ncbi:hypothetical protein HBB16_10255 [Pseudonocardia sp. MCCB 268]|nr:hypothetical protein [Pseudonocardia cytotoxica]